MHMLMLAFLMLCVKNRPANAPRIRINKKRILLDIPIDAGKGRDDGNAPQRFHLLLGLARRRQHAHPFAIHHDLAQAREDNRRTFIQK